MRFLNVLSGAWHNENLVTKIELVSADDDSWPGIGFTPEINLPNIALFYVQGHASFAARNPRKDEDGSSNGQRKRLGIGRCLAGEDEFLAYLEFRGPCNQAFK